MHRKAVFALAAVFLAVALVAPPVILFLQADLDLNNLIIIRDDPSRVTIGNVTITEETQEQHQANIIIVALVEVIFVLLFVITIYFGINQVAPEQEKADSEIGTKQKLNSNSDVK
jgi:hypothetical protein